MSGAEAEISRLREEITQLRALNNLNQEVNSQLGQNVERLKAILRLLIEDRRAERSAFQAEMHRMHLSREEGLRGFFRVAREALPDHHQVLENILQGLIQGSPEVFPTPFAG